jgi:extracellular matrix regulatory protein A
MKPITLDIGYKALISTDKILAILPWKSSPIKNLKKTAKDKDKLIDATYGHPTRSLILLEDGFIVLSATSTATLERRLNSHTIIKTGRESELEDEEAFRLHQSLEETQ